MFIYCITIACALRWGIDLVGFYFAGHCSPRRGTPFTVNVQGDGAHQRLILRRNLDCGFDLYFVKHILECLI